jgi:hypothetical protein
VKKKTWESKEKMPYYFISQKIIWKCGPMRIEEEIGLGWGEPHPHGHKASTFLLEYSRYCMML